jgi:hypothetical protein
MTRDEDNWHGAETPYSTRRIKTVNAGETDIHQNQIRLCAFRKLHGLLTIRRFDDSIALELQHCSEHDTRILIVVSDEDHSS